MMQTARIPVFIINLEGDRDRRDAMLAQFAMLPEFEPHVVNGIYGHTLSTNVCTALSQHGAWAEFKGTIGCFLSHVRAWEEVARLSEQYAVILEDDVDIAALRQLPPLVLPIDADIIFLNDRMAASSREIDALRALPVWHGLEHLDALHSGPGGDGYLLTPNAAKLLLAACLKDLYYGHVDGRLLRYSTSETDLAALSDNSWIAKVVRNHHHPRLVPTLGLLRGYCLSSPLVVHRGTASTREAEVIAAQDLIVHPPTKGSPLPIRYWNRTRNIGDLLNPYIVEAVSGRRPYYCIDENTEHVLGIGSILFMATQSSHVWGSGILDPTLDHSLIAVSKIHAVRGRLTQKILRDKYGLSKEVPLGDPAVFADELPELAQYGLEVPIKRKIGLVPHFAMEKSDYIAYLAEELDADILSPRTDNLSFVKEIMASEIIISQSLHGLIFAEVFSKPSVWLAHTSDDIWTFKFHDWFSNIAEPPLAPILFGTPPRDVLRATRLSGLSVDKIALRQAFPHLPPSSHKPGMGFRECRRSAPFAFLITSDLRAPANPDYDETFHCQLGDEEGLRRALNVYSRPFDEPFNLMLVFEPRMFPDLAVGDIQQCCDLLSRLPNTHFVSILPLSECQHDQRKKVDLVSLAGGLILETWQPSYAWKGVVLVRHPINFTFSAPGYAAFQTR